MLLEEGTSDVQALDGSAHKKEMWMSAAVHAQLEGAWVRWRKPLVTSKALLYETHTFKEWCQ